MSVKRPIIPWIAVAAAIILVAAAAFAFAATRASAAPTPTPTGVTAASLRPYEDPLLNTYGWVDQKNGIARIPISRAIDILAQRGLPSRPASAAPPDEGQTIPSYSSSGTQPRYWPH
jgi:hypothetical protein